MKKVHLVVESKKGLDVFSPEAIVKNWSTDDHKRNDAYLDYTEVDVSDEKHLEHLLSNFVTICASLGNNSTDYSDRKGYNVTKLHGFIFDIDNKPKEYENTDSKQPLTYDEALALLEKGKYSYSIYTSKSHLIDKDGICVDKFHIFIPFERPMDYNSELKFNDGTPFVMKTLYYNMINEVFPEIESCRFDKSVNDIARKIFPSFTPGKEKTDKFRANTNMDKPRLFISNLLFTPLAEVKPVKPIGTTNEYISSNISDDEDKEIIKFCKETRPEFSHDIRLSMAIGIAKKYSTTADQGESIFHDIVSTDLYNKGEKNKSIWTQAVKYIDKTSGGREATFATVKHHVQLKRFVYYTLVERTKLQMLKMNKEKNDKLIKQKEQAIDSDKKKSNDISEKISSGETTFDTLNEKSVVDKRVEEEENELSSLKCTSADIDVKIAKITEKATNNCKIEKQTYAINESSYGVEELQSSEYESLIEFAEDPTKIDLHYNSIKSKRFIFSNGEQVVSMHYSLNKDGKLNSPNELKMKKSQGVRKMINRLFGSYKPLKAITSQHIVGENNTDIHGITIQYDVDGNVLNLNQLIKHFAEKAILNNPLSSSDSMYKNGTLKLIDRIGVPIGDNWDEMCKNADEFDYVFEKLYNKYSPESYIALRRFLVQMWVERRTMAKPTLGVRSSKRGSGKSILLELCQSISSNYTSMNENLNDMFNGYASGNPIVRDDCETTEKDKVKLERTMKQISGNKKVSIRVPGGTYMEVEPEGCIIIMSNDYPMSISELPDSEANNQFLVIDAPDNLETINQLVLNFGKLSNYLHDRFADWMYTIGLKIYWDILQLRKEKHYRYGFPIPITDVERRCVGSSDGRDFERLMRRYVEQICSENGGIVPSSVTKGSLNPKTFAAPFSKGWVSINDLMALDDHSGVSKAYTKKDLIAYMYKNQYICDENPIKKSINNNNYNVWALNMDTIRKHDIFMDLFDTYTLDAEKFIYIPNYKYANMRNK